MMHELGIISLIILPTLFDDLHARFVFVAGGYPRRYGHGKSYKRARKHYKTNWTFWQRMLWIPVFKEWYEDKYRNMAYLSYVHTAFSLATILCFLLDEFVFVNVVFWHYVFGALGLFFIIRFCYDNALGQEKF